MCGGEGTDLRFPTTGGLWRSLGGFFNWLVSGRLFICVHRKEQEKVGTPGAGWGSDEIGFL